MATLSVRVLGELSIDGFDTRALADRKARQLLRLLALAQGRPVSAGALTDALWADAPPARPADQLAVLASRLRRALGRDAIEHGDDGYRLRYDWLDLDELGTVVAAAERRLADGNATGAVAAARIALSLVRGTLPEPASDAAWVAADHDAARRTIARARHVAARAMLATGDWLDALDLATLDARTDPYDEEAVRLVMQANAQGGRPAVALAVYAELCRTLADELGTDPAPETAALHTAILRGELPTAPPVRRTPVHLVGRTSQLEHLDGLVSRLADGKVRVAVVTGEAGIGKTTLLRAWSDARAAAGDIVLFGACGPLERSAPLDAVMVALGEHVRRSDDPGGLLRDDAAVLAPLLGVDAPADGSVSVLPVDLALGTAGLYAAITRLLRRISADRRAIVVIDDAHLAGPALVDWMSFTRRRSLPLLIVAAARPAEMEPVPFADMVGLGPLDREATVELVGAERADDLYARSGGHPLFLTELARSAAERLPPSLIEAVDRLCDQLGETAAGLLRTAAVLGTEIDIDLVASVVGRPPLDVLTDVERAEARELLVEQSGRYTFRHALVREALAAGTPAARVTLLHRHAATSLDRRPGADPVAVADHARLGGDTALAASALRTAALRAAERFDHATAEQLLDQSLDLLDDDRTRLARARVRIRRGRYAEAEADADATTTVAAEASELRAWASYFDRRFDDAVAHARDGELAADDVALLARCRIIGGRTLHARGDLAAAEHLLTDALETASGADRLTAAAWLGVLLAHRSQCDRALELLRPATRPGIGADHTSATLHALLFVGQAHAFAGRPALALDAFTEYTGEVDRRQVPRFAGRGVNSAGWVLRNVGVPAAAVDAHEEALACAQRDGTPEVLVAALEDLADDRLLAGDPGAALALLARAAPAFDADLVFGWRLRMKRTLLESRAALLSGVPEDALRTATELAAAASAAQVPRYASVARLLVHQARSVLGEPVDLDEAWHDLETVGRSVGIEAWWWAGDTGVVLGQEAWLDRAEELAAELATHSGPYADALHAEADRRLAGWRHELGTARPARRDLRPR